MIYFFSDFDSITSEKLDSYIDILPPLRKNKAESYRFLKGKKTCVIAYLLFLYGYRKEYGLKDTPDFEIAKNGKPYLKNHPEIHFNISHCEKAVICAFSDSPIGADIEVSRRITPSLINKVCSDNEIKEINESEDNQLTFCRIWTIKEAVAKLSGEGIAGNLKELNGSNICTVTEFIAPDMYITIASEKTEAIVLKNINDWDLTRLFY